IPFPFLAFGSAGAKGGDGEGGGLDVSSSSGQVHNVAIIDNTTAGGVGGSAGTSYTPAASGDGGKAAGGGLNINNSTLSLTNATVSGNVAQGGSGANSPQYTFLVFGGPGGNGGHGAGGGVYAAGSTLTMANIDVSANSAQGGDGGRGSDAPPLPGYSF